MPKHGEIEPTRDHSNHFRAVLTAAARLQERSLYQISAIEVAAKKLLGDMGPKRTLHNKV